MADNDPIVRLVRRKFVCSQEAAEDLMWLWGLGGPEYPDNALDRLSDALEDPDYNPSDQNYKGLPRWPDGSVATREEYLKYHPTESLITQMADEMAKEIDEEILKSMKRYCR